MRRFDMWRWADICRVISSYSSFSLRRWEPALWLDWLDQVRTKKKVICLSRLIRTQSAWCSEVTYNKIHTLNCFFCPFVSRSSLTCPHCLKQSNTFDPFSCISLPIPLRQTRWCITHNSYSLCVCVCDVYVLIFFNAVLAITSCFHFGPIMTVSKHYYNICSAIL